MCVPSLFEMLHWPHDVRGRGKQWQDALNGSTDGRGDWQIVNAQIISSKASVYKDNVLPFCSGLILSDLDELNCAQFT